LRRHCHLDAPQLSVGPAAHAQIETIFRREAARLISVLTRIFGPHNLQLAEDVVQEAFVAALEVWSERGIPKNPAAWLLSAARNRAIDAIRRERTRRTFAPDLAVYLDSEWTVARTVGDAFDADGVRDDQLRMLFMCCHPSLTPENRLTLVLRALCGLSIPAIARALLTTEPTIHKRLYRTRRRLEGVDFTLPSPGELPGARDTVHVAMYLLFNEGFLSTGDEPILAELCDTALSLTRMLAAEQALASEETLALLALMCFNRARLESRLDEEGRLVPLDRQDRTLWDRARINEGYALLARTLRTGSKGASRYHIEAAIAARHCSARAFDTTDWESICKLYDRLLEVSPTGLIALNRAVAISYRDGPEAAIPLVEALRKDASLRDSHSIAAVLANLYARVGSAEPARRFLAEAMERTPTKHERALIALQVERARHARQPGL
jgi:RNA polymerase sigma-70 factor (ECF subfamily)